MVLLGGYCSLKYICKSPQVLQLTAMPTLAVAVVESFLTMLDVEAPSPLSSAAQIKELVSTTANTVKMLESDAQVFCVDVVLLFLSVCHCIQILVYSKHYFTTVLIFPSVLINYKLFLLTPLLLHADSSNQLH